MGWWGVLWGKGGNLEGITSRTSSRIGDFGCWIEDEGELNIT